MQIKKKKKTSEVKRWASWTQSKHRSWTHVLNVVTWFIHTLLCYTEWN